MSFYDPNNWYGQDSQVRTEDMPAPAEPGDDIDFEDDVVPNAPSREPDRSPLMSSDFLSAVNVPAHIGEDANNGTITPPNQGIPDAISRVQTNFRALTFPPSPVAAELPGTRTPSALEVRERKETSRKKDLSIGLKQIRELETALQKAAEGKSAEQLTVAISNAAITTNHLLDIMMPDMLAELEAAEAITFTEMKPSKPRTGEEAYTFQELTTPLQIELNSKTANLNVINISDFGLLFTVHILDGSVSEKITQNCFTIAGSASSGKPGLQMTFYGPTQDSKTVVTDINTELAQLDALLESNDVRDPLSVARKVRNISYIAFTLAKILMTKCQELYQEKDARESNMA